MIQLIIPFTVGLVSGVIADRVFQHRFEGGQIMPPSNMDILTLLALQNPDLTVADAANIMGNRSPYRPGNRNIRFTGPDQSNG